MSTPVGERARSAGRVSAAVRDLHPGYFAFVMATGIISTGTFLLGPSLLSLALLAAGRAAAGFPRHGRRGDQPVPGGHRAGHLDQADL